MGVGVSGGVAVRVGLGVAVIVGEGVGMGEAVAEGVDEGVELAVAVSVGVDDGARVAVGPAVGVLVCGASGPPGVRACKYAAEAINPEANNAAIIISTFGISRDHAFASSPCLIKTNEPGRVIAHDIPASNRAISTCPTCYGSRLPTPEPA